MSQRSCNHLTAGCLCSAVVHTSRRVGVPGHGPVWVNLCFAHRETGDAELEILARAKASRQTIRRIQPDGIVPGMPVQDIGNHAICIVRLVTDNNVRVSYPNGSSTGMSRKHLIRNFQQPQTT